MIRKDYLMKMVEEAAFVVARLLGLRKEGKYEEAVRVLDETYDSFFKFEGKLLRFTAKEDLLDLLIHQEKLDENQMTVLADLLRAEAEVWLDEGKWETAKDVLEKALIVLKYVNTVQKKIYSLERVNKMDLIEKRLTELE